MRTRHFQPRRECWWWRPKMRSSASTPCEPDTESFHTETTELLQREASGVHAGSPCVPDLHSFYGASSTSHAGSNVDYRPDAPINSTSAATNQGGSHGHCCLCDPARRLLQEAARIERTYVILEPAFASEEPRTRWFGRFCLPSGVLWSAGSPGARAQEASQLKWLLSAILGEVNKFRADCRQIQQPPSAELPPDIGVVGQFAATPEAHRQEAFGQAVEMSGPPQNRSHLINVGRAESEEEREAPTPSEGNLPRDRSGRNWQHLKEMLLKQDVTHQEQSEIVEVRSPEHEFEKLSIRQLEWQLEQVQRERDMLNQACIAANSRGISKFAQQEIETLKGTLEQVTAEKDGLQKQLQRLSGESYLDSEANPTLVQQMAERIKGTLSSFTKAYMQLEPDGSRSAMVDRNAALLQGHVVKLPRSTHVKYSFEAAISHICFKDFESPTMNGLKMEPCLDREKARAAAFEEFQHAQVRAAADVSPQLGTPLSQFCYKKFAEIWSTDSMDTPVLGNVPLTDLDARRIELYSIFGRFATSVWLMHLLCASFEPAATSFKVNPESDFDPTYMESVAIREESEEECSPVLKVAFMVVPGFRAGRSIVKSQVYLQ